MLMKMSNICGATVESVRSVRNVSPAYVPHILHAPAHVPHAPASSCSLCSCTVESWPPSPLSPHPPMCTTCPPIHTLIHADLMYMNKKNLYLIVEKVPQNFGYFFFLR